MQNNTLLNGAVDPVACRPSQIKIGDFFYWPRTILAYGYNESKKKYHYDIPERYTKENPAIRDVLDPLTKSDRGYLLVTPTGISVVKKDGNTYKDYLSGETVAEVKDHQLLWTAAYQASVATVSALRAEALQLK